MMIKQFLIPVFASCLLLSCNNDTPRAEEKNETAERPESPEEAFDRALGLIQEMKADEALVIFEKLSQQKEYAAQAYSGMGICYLVKKQPEKALAQYEKALQIDPSSYQAQIGIGSACLDLKRYEQALEYFRIARQTDPTLPDSYHSLAIAFDRMNQADSAVAHAKKFLEMAPDAQYDYDIQQIMKKYSK